MVASRTRDFQQSDWSVVPAISSLHQQWPGGRNSITIRSSTVNPVNGDSSLSSEQSKTKPQKKTSIPPLVRGLLLGILPGCIILAIILPIWLIKKPTPRTVTQTTSALRWNSTGITVAGTGGYGNAVNQLKGPWDLTVDYSNTLYVTDRYNHRVQKFARGSVTGITVAGRANGTFGTSLYDLCEPTGIQVDSNGNMYIADKNNDRILFWPNGSPSGQIIAGNGTRGVGSNMLNLPYGIELDHNSGTVYISDNFNHRIMSYPLNGPQSGTLVAGGNGPGGNNSQLIHPVAFYFESLSNSLIISNDGRSNIVRWVLGATNWTLIAGNMNGSAGTTMAEFRNPTDVTLDPMGNMYVADRFNHRIQFFPIDRSVGMTIAGISNMSGNSSILLSGPTSLALDNQLNLYVVDQSNSRVQLFQRY